MIKRPVWLPAASLVLFVGLNSSRSRSGAEKHLPSQLYSSSNSTSIITPCFLCPLNPPSVAASTSSVHSEGVDWSCTTPHDNNVQNLSVMETEPCCGTLQEFRLDIPGFSDVRVREAVFCFFVCVSCNEHLHVCRDRSDRNTQLPHKIIY